MRLRSALVVATLLIACVSLPGSTVAQADVTCADFDAWEWAQLVYDTAATSPTALDPDGDGIACPELPRGLGFAPAIWTDTIPADVEEAQIIRLIDGDTLELLLNGVSNRVRIYRADTPETQNERHCGGPEATAFAEYALRFNDNAGVVYLERDVNTRDQYGRELAYVWFTVDGLPYMLNHLLIATGWAEDVDYGDRKYDAQFREAAAFAQRHQLGVYSLCGGWTPTPVPAPIIPTPTPAPNPQPEPSPPGECDPSYPTVCIPPISVYGDLDCRDVPYRRFQVVPPDPHGFDGDYDGVGCESG